MCSKLISQRISLHRIGTNKVRQFEIIMAGKFEETPAIFDASEIVRMNIDLLMDNGTIGLFTVDLTASPKVTMGYIRSKIGEALGVSQEDITIIHDNTIVPDKYFAKNYYTELKELNDENLSLIMDEEKQKFVALILQKRIKEKKGIQNIGISIVIEEICDDKDITLTIFKPCFNLYVERNL